MIEYALIVAGGSGLRMAAAIPKQFLLLNGVPILMHTIEAFHNYSHEIKIILVLPHDQFSTWQKHIEDYKLEIKHQVVSGGPSRFESVRNGLDTIEGHGIVAIHDGVRPLVSKELINNCFKSAAKRGSGIASIMPKDSLRRVGNDKNESVDRGKYRLMQTPQAFSISTIKLAYSQAEAINHTDDASVAEAAGQEIVLVTGEYTNIKITTPEDLIIAQALINVGE